MTKSKVITRFAPSPTGFLHIGGARTALFNWLYARRHDGEFRLRVEDTDRARSTPEATQAILDGMAWLGLDHDGDIIYQSKNADIHAAAALNLLEQGAAYRCYCTSEELTELREISRESGTAFRSPWRDAAIDNAPDKPYAIRFRVPEGQTSITDQVQGKITWDNDQFDDLVLLRADGTPTYMLAVVVDDHNMEVTHVIRGDDHLINAGRQSLIYEALGWDIPVWAHVPLIHGPDGKKLSKRHGALGVEAYEEMGYTAEGLRNYLLKLGWAHGDQELFFDEDAQNLFDLEGINSSPARLDFDKMDYINAQHIMRMDDATLLSEALPFIEAANNGPISVKQTEFLNRAIDSLKPRSKTYKALAEHAGYLLLSRPYEITGKTSKSLKKSDTLGHLSALISDLEAVNSAEWTSDALQSCLGDYVSRHDIGFGKIGQPVRAALTAGHPAPDLSLVLFVLGKDESIGRLQDAVKQFRDLS